MLVYSLVFSVTSYILSSVKIGLQILGVKSCQYDIKDLTEYRDFSLLSCIF